MGSVLHVAAFLAICWLFRGAVTHANQYEDKVLNNKHSNPGPGAEDFYFEEQKATDDNLKTAKAVPQSAWLIKDKEQTEKVENKRDFQFSNEFSFKNALSYFINMLHELKKDVLGLKEKISFKDTKNLTNSRDKSEDNGKPNKKEKNNDAPKSDTSTKNNEFAKGNQKPKSNYLTDYYKKKGMKFVDDDLETSSDDSDDSSHKPNGGPIMHEVNKKGEYKCIAECSEKERKPGRYPSGAGETTAIPTSETKIPEESNKEFNDTRNDEKGDSFKGSTRKPSKKKQSNSKTSREGIENIPISKMGRCMKMNKDNSDNLNEKNEHTEKPLRSDEYVTRSPRNKNFNKAKSERPNQNKSNDDLSKMSSTSPDSRNSGKKSKNEDGSDFDSKSGILRQSTTLPSHGSKAVVYSENIENEQDASGISSKKPIYKKQQEQTTSPKPDGQEQAQELTSTLSDSGNSGKKSKNEDGSDLDSKSGILGQSTTLSSQSSKDVVYPETIKNEQDASGISSKKPTYKKQQEQPASPKPDDQTQAQNNARSLKNNYRSNEYSTVSLQPHELGSEMPNGEISTDTEIQNNPKESKDKRLDVNSSHTTVPYSENEPDSKTDGTSNSKRQMQTSNNFDTGNTISPTNSENIMNKENLHNNPSDNLIGKKGTNGDEKSAATQQVKDYLEAERDSETQTKPQQLNNSEPEKTLKNNKLNDSNRENNNKERDDNLTAMATNDLPSPQYSDSEIQNQDVEESDKPQEEEKNNGSLHKRDVMLETSPDQEYDFEEDNEDYDISDELTDTEMDGDFNENEEGDLITNNKNEMNDDEINEDNTTTVLRNESKVSRHTVYVLEENPQEQYDTFLEYFYKHSNNTLFQALKNQSNNFSR